MEDEKPLELAPKVAEFKVPPVQTVASDVQATPRFHLHNWLSSFFDGRNQSVMPSFEYAHATPAAYVFVAAPPAPPLFDTRAYI